MKRKLLTFGLLLPLCSASWADDHSSYENWVGGFFEYYNADSDKPEPMGYLDDGFGIGGEIGHRLNEQWGLRLEFSRLDLDISNPALAGGNSDDKGIRAGVDAMYFANDDLFYLFGGIKHATYGESHRLGNIGLGKHWYVNERWRVISEAAVYHDFGEGFRDYGIKLGLAYTWGETSFARGPSDRDGDGVFDNLDQCPDTPPGTDVDSRGCNNDQDGDGVVNAADACPDTPAGTRVDARGCNWDSDGDGVGNDIDRCPNTPKGTEVGAKGCALTLDSDEDGVLDDNDQCPETPLTDKVDTVGCSVFTDKEVTIDLRVLFANNSAEVANPDDEQFQTFADFMARFPNTQADIEGHSSAVGAAEYNQQLSERRANAVRDLLISQYGLDGSRLNAVGYGETRLLDDSNTAEASRINRRIEARVTAQEKVKVRRGE